VGQRTWSAVDRYIADLFVPADPVLDHVLATSDAAGLPPIAVAPNQGKLLMMLAQLQGARRILEIGTLGGYSTIWLARGLSRGGRIVTLEADRRHAEVAEANFANAGLSRVIALRVGPALDTLPRLARDDHGPFDLVFIDADKENNTAYFAWALKLARRGSLIIADNVVREGAVIDARSRDRSVTGIRRFNRMVAAEPRVTATAIQTVGSKGYDGLAVIRVIAEP
jgi:predicted O-methyltransferase YrrM